MKRQHTILLLIFVICLLSRIAFKFLSGYNNFELFTDAQRYDILSTNIINGNFNLDIVAYLAAPLYIYTLAIFKTISSNNWEFIAVSFQFVLISFSAVYIYKISKALFKNEMQGIIAACLYVFYPMTMWFNFTLSQETSFQAFFIFFIYYFLKLNDTPNKKNLFWSTLFFALALLTKSHILILVPFLLLILWQKNGIKCALLFILLSFLYTIPHGLYNKKKHGIYTVSSHGNASFFLLGHSEETYHCLMHKTGEVGDFSAEGCNPGFVFNKEFEFKNYGKVNALPVKERDKLRLLIAFDWIKNNPAKYWELKKFGIKRFILPGLDYKQFKFNFWLLSFIAGLLIYLPAYFYLLLCLRENWKRHLLIISVIIVTAAIFIVFFPVNRFRVITLEPLLIVYAAGGYARMMRRLVA